MIFYKKKKKNVSVITHYSIQKKRQHKLYLGKAICPILAHCLFLFKTRFSTQKNQLFLQVASYDSFFRHCQSKKNI